MLLGEFLLSKHTGSGCASVAQGLKMWGAVSLNQKQKYVQGQSHHISLGKTFFFFFNCFAAKIIALVGHFKTVLCK